MGTTRK